MNIRFISEIMNKNFYGNTITDWLKALLLIVLSLIVAKVILWLFKNIIKKYTKKTKTELDDIIIDVLEEPLVFFILVLGIEISILTLKMAEPLKLTIEKLSRSILILLVAWALTRLLEILITKYLAPFVEKTEGDMDDQLLPILKKGLKITIWIIAIIVALDNAGYKVTTIIAGLGIGGLAFALAAQDTISNLFGGITIFIDKPFKIGDRIKIGGIDGTVKEVGIRSSKVETLEGRTIAVQNANFLKTPIENISSESSRKVMTTLGLEYSTSYDGMKKGIEILNNIVKSNNNLEEKVIASFSSFGESSMDILFIYYIKKGGSIADIKSEVNFEILKQFGENGLEFAFPSKTVYNK